MMGNRFSRGAGLMVVIVAVAAGCTGRTGGGTGKGGGSGVGGGSGESGGGGVDGGLADGGGGSGGGGTGGGGSGGNLSNWTFQCNGNVATPDGSESTPLPGVPPLTVCVPAGTDEATAAAKCQPKCMDMLSMYITDINNANPNSPAVTNVQCDISSASHEPADCPTLDPPPGAQEPQYSGGAAQYVASMTGNMNLSVGVDTGIPGIGSVTVSQNSPTSGVIGYTILPIDLFCPPDGCQLLITGFDLGVADFDIGLDILGETIFDHNVTGMAIQNAGWITGLWHNDGHFEIPINAGQVAMTANDNGNHTSIATSNGSTITGTINPTTGVVSFDTFTQADGNATATISGLSGTNFTGPPTAVISAPPATVECNQPGAALVTLNGTTSTAPNNDVRFYSWQINGAGPVLSGATVAATLPLGTNTIALDVMNSTFAVGVATKTVTVVDTTPPVIAPPSTVTAETCSDGSTTVTLTPPRVTDACNPSPTVTGTVISTSPTIPVVNGRVSLPPGTYTVRWTASDGHQTSTATQTLVVQPGILVKGQFLLDDRAKLQTASGGPAGLGNAGTVTTNIGNDTTLGDILSVAPVVLLDRAIVQGSIRSNKTITLGNSDNVAGSVVPNSSVSLPPVPDLTGVTFPSPSGGSPTFNPTNPPGGTVPLAPGSYGTVNINSGARVSLSAGTYYFQQLLINAASSTLVIPTTGVVRIFVASQLAYRGQVVTPAGQQAQIFLGYNGTSSAVLEAPFLGTFVAPRGAVSIGTSSAQLFRGRFFGQSLEVRPGIQLTCDTSVTAQ